MTTPRRWQTDSPVVTCMSQSNARIPTGKWHKHLILQKHPLLRNHLPSTRVFHPHSLNDRLRGYGCAIIKPVWGEGGAMVCRVCKNASGYMVQHGSLCHQVHHSRDMVRVLPKWTRTRPCVIQKYIELHPVHGRAVDVRVIVQKCESGLFEVTGTFTKTAPPHRVVTNVKQGGTVAHVLPYVRRVTCDEAEARKLEQNLHRLSRLIGDYLGTRFSNTVYGIDLGVDTSKRIWIIEVNTNPSLSILRDIDKGMYNRAVTLRRWHKHIKLRPASSQHGRARVSTHSEVDQT